MNLGTNKSLNRGLNVCNKTSIMGLPNIPMSSQTSREDKYGIQKLIPMLVKPLSEKICSFIGGGKILNIMTVR